MPDDLESKWEALTGLADQLRREKAVPGLTIGVLHDGETRTAAFGVANMDEGTPLTPKTLAQIGSISKTFTATLCLRLVEEGLLDLDAPVQGYLPDFRVADEEVSAQVTARHLLTHSGGWDGDLFADTGEGADAFAAYTAKMTTREQMLPLGEAFSYNNAGFHVLGELIEKLAGKRYEDVLREWVLEPLGMERSALNAGEAIAQPVATGHTFYHGEHQVARPWAVPRTVLPVGGIISNVAELLKYATLWVSDGKSPEGKKVLEKASVAEMLSPQMAIWEGDGSSVGLSWFLQEVDGVQMIRHGGATLGQTAGLFVVPSKGFALAMLVNSGLGPGIIQQVARAAFKEYLGLEPPKPEAIESTPEELAAFAGVYERPFSTLELGMLAGRLVGQIVFKAGFPSEDSPPAPPPPPFSLARCEANRLLITDGNSKGYTIDIFRREDGSIEYGRLGLRMNRFTAVD